VKPLTPITEEMADLLESLCVEELSPAQAERLEDLVFADENCRDHYIIFLHMHAVAERFQGAEGGCKANQLDNWLPPCSEPSSVASGSPFSSSALFFIGNAWQDTTAYFNFDEHPARFSYLVASMLFVIVGIVASHIYVTTHSVQNVAENGSNQTPSDINKRLPSVIEQKIKRVGRIVNMVDCKWSRNGQVARDPCSVASENKTGERQPPIPNSQSLVSLGDKLILASGLMEIAYDAGARVILEGPCTFNVETNGGFLAIGRLTGKLEKTVGRGQWAVDSAKPQAASNESTNQQPPATSHSSNSQFPIPNPPLSTIHCPRSTAFVIATPTAIVTDLGTEFGVEVNRVGDTISHVFRGVVKMAGVGGLEGEIVLAANESAQAKMTPSASNRRRGVVRRMPNETSSATAFVRSLPSRRSIGESEAYGRLVLSMHPAVYYRMEPPKDHGDRFQLLDSASGRHHGVIHFPEGFMDATPYTAGRFGHSIRLRGPMVKDCAIVTDYPKTTDDRLTVSVWAMVMGRASLATLAANRFIIREKGHAFGQFILYLHPDNAGGDLAARITQRNGEDKWIREGREEMFPLGTWQHVALVIDKTTMRLYRNGRELASGHCDGILLKPPRSYLTIGAKGLPEDMVTQDEPGYWPGFIDELAIFNRALSAEEIGQLFLGKPVGRTASDDPKIQHN
jgi:hypothetical protein